MTAKRIFLTIFITAAIITIILIALKAYYVAIAIVVGSLLIGHREIRSLLTKRKFPVIDERVQENLTKSVRNGFIFLIFAIVFLMLPFTTSIVNEPEVVHVLGGLFLAGGLVYLLSYLFYDRAEANLSGRWRKMLKTFLLVTAVGVATFIISVFLHNAISALFEIEEPVFFVMATIISPMAIVVGLAGVLVIFTMGFFRHST